MNLSVETCLACMPLWACVCEELLHSYWYDSLVVVSDNDKEIFSHHVVNSTANYLEHDVWEFKFIFLFFFPLLN